MTLPKIPDDERDWNSIEIFLFSNGQQFSPPRKYNLSSETLRVWDETLNHLAELQFGAEAPKIDLFTLDGERVHGPMELTDGSAFVAVKRPDDFTQTGYNKYLMKASRSWEKRQERKLPNIAPDKGNPKPVNSPRQPQRQVKTSPNVKSKNAPKIEETNITSAIAKDKNTRIFRNINTKRPVLQSKDKTSPKVTTQVDITEENKRINKKISEIKTDNEIEKITSNENNINNTNLIPINIQNTQSSGLSQMPNASDPITNTFNVENLSTTEKQKINHNNTRDQSVSINRGGVVNLKLNIHLKNNDILKREYNEENVYIKQSNNSFALEKASQVNIDLNFSGLNLPKYESTCPATDNSPTIMIFRCKCNQFGVDNRIASYEQENNNTTNIKLAAVNENNIECCKCDIEKIRQMKDQTQQLIDSLTRNAFDLSSAGQYLTPKLDTNPNSKEPQSIAIIDSDKQAQDEVLRNSINGKNTLDEYSQTDWSNVLLESRCQPDGHYTFHLPPLRVIKPPAVQQFNK